MRKRSLTFIFCVVISFSLHTSCQLDQSNNAPPDPFWEGKTQISLINFEEPELLDQLKIIQADAKLVANQGVSDGKQALALSLQADEKETGFEWKPKIPIDAGELQDYCLVFEAANFGDHSTHLYVKVENPEGKSRLRSASIPIGPSQTYYFELEGKFLRHDTNMRDNPPPWENESTQMKMRGRIEPIDFSKIASIKFYTKNTLWDKNLIVDNLRLVKTPKIAEDYLVGIIDRYGQNAKENFEGKITSDEQLKTLAEEELRQLEEEGPMPGRSKFGGWADGPKLDASGFFRTEKVGNKWALVDPEGYLFFSSGIANVRMANTTTFTGIDFKNDAVRYKDPEDVTPEDSRGMVNLSRDITNTAYVAYPERNKMFLELPEYDHPLANHYSYRREQHFGPFEHGETFSFYQANLERRYGEDSPGAHLEKWVDVTLDRFLNWGFTSFGNWTAYEFYHKNRMPYFANGWIIGDFKTVQSGMDFWGPMPDVFDPEFERRVKVTVQVVAEEVKNSPWCIGVFIDNEKSWGVPGTVEGQYGIIFNALSLNAADSPLKTEFIRLLKAKYPSISALNSAWDSDIENWVALGKGINFLEKSDFSTAMVNDLSMLLEAYATQYFQTVHDALEQEMPDHLYMGCRFASWGMGEEVRKASKKYVDVFSYNYYEEGVGKKYWTFLEEIDRPSILGEFHIGTAASGLFHHGVIHAADHEDRAKMYKDYLQSVVDNPYFVGAHWFQYLDSPVSGRAHDGENYNVGFVSNTDVPYPSLVKASKEFHKNLYQKRYGQ